ncbi:MAG: folylpolyglutamate synthase/dihydrofolate synthase family protein [Chloroflexota bacterium]
MRYHESIAFLEELVQRPHEPASVVGLERAARLLAEIGDPQTRFRSVHVAGSSGKGSTTTMIASVLQRANLRTGVFRSPHLRDYTERITVDGHDIARQDWIRCFQQVWPVVEDMQDNRLPGYRFGRPSLFEILFAMAALYCAERNVHWAAIETGMGGRLDATNTLQPDVAVVTNVSLEHTHILGDTVQEIAREKAAIIKEGAHSVTAADGEALDVIRARAQRVHSPLTEVPRDIAVRVTSPSLHGQTIQLATNNGDVAFTMPLAGGYQARNAATAYGAIRALRARGIDIPEAAVVQGFEHLLVPGRFEIISDQPLVLVDGAQNIAGCVELASSLSTLPAASRRVLLFATMKDKDIVRMALTLGPAVDEVVVTTVPGTDRGASPDSIAPSFGRVCPHVSVEPDVDRALHEILDRAAQDTMVIVAGSLYLVGFARDALMRAGVL